MFAVPNSQGAGISKVQQLSLVLNANRSVVKRADSLALLRQVSSDGHSGEHSQD